MSLRNFDTWLGFVLTLLCIFLYFYTRRKKASNHVDLKKLLFRLLFVVWILFLVSSTVDLYLYKRHGFPSSRKSKVIERLAEQNDLLKLHEMLVNETSLRVKAEIMMHLSEKRSIESVPYLIEMLDYDWDDWEKAVYAYWSRQEARKPAIVRFYALAALSDYGDEINEQLIKAAREGVGYKQLYASILLFKRGLVDYSQDLEYYSQDPKYSDDVDFIREYGLYLDVDI